MKSNLFSLGIFLIIIFFVYRSLLLNLSTNLPDWLDYSLVNWIIFQNVDKIIHFNFINFFDTNAFFPNRFTLFFSDIYLPQALIALPFYLLFKNYVLTFNIVFFITLCLDYFSCYIFWKYLFKNYFVAILGALLVFFSPFFYLEKSHFQMISYWPFFLSLLCIFKYESNKKISSLVIGSIFFAIQFLASVYIFVFLAFTVFLYYLIRFFWSSNKTLVIKSLLIIIIIFTFIDGIFIKGYFDMKREYNFQRDFKEYITYSANLSDYLFTNRIDSTLYSFPIFKKWNSIDKNSMWGSAQFPGFFVFILGLFGLIKFRSSKENIEVIFGFNKEKLFFFSLIIIGFVFSLGPRVIFNNTYSHIPAPYAVFLKLIPLLESIRAVCRWSFLFYIGFIYYALFTLNSLQKKFNLIVFTFLLSLIFLEYIPLNISTHSETLFDENYSLISNLCSNQKQVLLEIPVTHLNVYPDIGTGVNYISKVEFSSLYHKCYLVNGYSGYDLPTLFSLNDNLYGDISTMNSSKFIADIKKSEANIIKINKSFLPIEIQIKLPAFLKLLSSEKGIKTLNGQIYLIK